MKKTLIFVIAMMVGAGAFAINAKDNKKKTTVASAPAKAVLVNSNDTLSYAAGMALTNGLVNYLTGQLKVDTAYMADFVKGFKETLKSSSDPSFNAYSAGIDIAKQLKDRMLPNIQSQLRDTPDSIIQDKFVEGFIAGINKDTTIYNEKVAGDYFEARMKASKEAKKEKLSAAGKKFLEENAKKDGVITTASGLQYKVLVKGDGPIPTANQEVNVKYEGRLIDGTIFDSSYERKDQVNKFRCNRVIKGWTEALTMMPVGSTWEIYVPQELAYGEQGMGKIKPYSTLIFKVELISIENTETTAKPAEAAKTPTPAKKVVAKKK